MFNMNQTYPPECKKIAKNLAQRKPRIFSEHMNELRRPFLCNENYNYANLQHSKASKEKPELKDNKVKEMLKTRESGTRHDFKQDLSESDPSNSIDLNEGTENSFCFKNYIGKDFETPIMCKTEVNIKYADEYNKNFKANLNKRLNIGDSTTELETSAISDYFTDDSESKSKSLESDISIQGISFSGLLKPLKNSTFIIQGETAKCNTSYRKRNETFISEDNCNSNDIIKTKARSYSDFIEKKYHYQTKGLQVPSIIKNENNIISKAFEKNENEIVNRMQMELFKQIDAKDKVMSQLLELSQCSEFPKLRHLCCSECEQDQVGVVCKKIKSLESDAKLQDGHSGVLKYIWSTIKYPFTPVSPTTLVKVESIARKNPVTKAYMKLKNKKENSIKLKDHKHQVSEMQTEPNGTIDFVQENQKKTFNKTKARNKF